MSWLARLLGRAPDAVPPAATTVVVPPDLAERLTASGTPLDVAVESVLREHLATAATNGDTHQDQQGNGDKPFWLEREQSGAGDLEERLRDRIAQRRSTEGEAER